MGPLGKWIDGIDPDASVCEAARLSLKTRLIAVAHYLPLAAYHAEQDAEFVHRLRVSTRRAAAALNLYRDWLPGKRARWVRKRLKRIRRTAAEARDLDVLAKRLKREHGAHAAAVLDVVRTERAAVQPAIARIAERLCRRDRFMRKSAKLVNLVRRPKGRDSVEDVPRFREWAAERLAGAAEPFFAAMPDDTCDMAALHQFRIRGKGLRYAMELLASAFGPELRKIQYPLIEELQERLGRINDCVVAQERLRTWASDDRYRAQKSYLCDLAEYEVARLADELSDFHDWWTPAVARRLSRELAHSA